MTHNWSVEYPRGTWPVYTCRRCDIIRSPRAEELSQKRPPSWWDNECKAPKPLSQSDAEWLLGVGRYGQ